MIMLGNTRFKLVQFFDEGRNPGWMFHHRNDAKSNIWLIKLEARWICF
jgi:hypothetical protein